MQQAIYLLTIFAVTPPVAIESKNDLGTFADGGFTAAFTLTANSFEVSDNTGQATVVAQLRLHGKTGNLSINNPFWDAQLLSTCHIVVYDNAEQMVALEFESLGRATPAVDTAEMRLTLIPGRAFGRTIRFQIPQDRVGARRALYAQAVLLDSAPFWNRPSVQIGDVNSLAEYRAAVLHHIVAVSEPIHLKEPQRVHKTPDVTRETGVSVSLFRPNARPDLRKLPRIAARLTNNSHRNVYVAPHLYLPVYGRPAEPTLVLETRDGRRVGAIDNGQAYWPSESGFVCRLPPAAFIECEWTYRLHEFQETAIATANAPVVLRLIDVPVLTRDPIAEPLDVTLSRPKADVFSRLPVAPSNPIEIDFVQ